MKYYYLDDAGNQSPAPVDVTQLLACGVTPQTMVWCEGMANWAPASSVPEVASLFMGAAPTQMSYQQPQQGAYQQPYQQAAYQQGAYQQPYQQGAYQQAQQPMQKPQSWLWLGIVTTLLCCLPTGIASIVYASKVDNLWNMGDYQGAIDASKKAQMWGWIGAGLGFVVSFIYIVALLLV